jgi:hypothetical protein
MTTTISTTNYNVTPITSNCPNTSSNVVIKPLEGSATGDTLNNVSSQNEQLLANTQYDTINNDSTIQSGGKKNKKYNISFINKNYIVYEKDELKAIKNIINNKKYKKEHVLSINKSLYIIKNTKNNNNNIKKV